MLGDVLSAANRICAAAGKALGALTAGAALALLPAAALAQTGPGSVSLIVQDSDGASLTSGDPVEAGDEISVSFYVGNFSPNVDFTDGQIDFAVFDIFPGADVTLPSFIDTGACGASATVAEAADVVIRNLDVWFNCFLTFDFVIPEDTTPGSYTLVTSAFTGTETSPAPGAFSQAVADFDFTVVADTTPPTATITGPDGPTQDPFDIQVAFSETVDGFDASDLTVTNGTATLVAPLEGGSLTNARLEITPTGGTPLEVVLPADSAFDAAGNGNTESNTFQIDIGAPEVDPVSLSLSFTDDPVLPGGTVTVEITIENNSGSDDLTGGFFSFDGDAAPFLDNGSTPVTPLPSNPCGAGSFASAVGDDVALSGISLLAGESCTFSFQMRTNGSATPGGYVHASQNWFYSLDSVPTTGVNGSDTLVIGGGEETGTIEFSKTFTDDPVTAGDQVTLEFTILTSGGFTTTDLAFTDDLDAALTGLVATGLPASNVCGAGSTLSGTDTITLADGNLGDGGSCTFSVTLDVPAGAATGDYVNTTSALTATRSDFGASTIDAATDTLSVIAGAAANPTVTISGPAGNVAAAFSVDIRFSEPVTGFEVGDITVTNGAASDLTGADTDYSATITPAGLGALTVDVLAGVAQDADSDPNDASNTYSTTVVAAEPEIAVSGNGTDIADGSNVPTSADHTFFGTADVAVGSVTRTFTISSEGTGDLTLTGGTPVTISGTHAADFSVVAQPSSPIATGDTATFQITFDPSATGSRVATISIASDDADENPFEFDISGVGGSAPEINVTNAAQTVSILDGDATPSAAETTDFGTVNIAGSTQARTFVIQNLGSATLTLGASAVSIDDDRFTVTTQPDTSVAASGTTSFIVEFDPDEVAAVNAVVSINSNDTDENPYTFAVTGDGLDDVPPSGQTVAFDDDYYSPANGNVSNASFTLFNGEVFSSFAYTISSDGGGTNLTGSGEIDVREAGSAPEDYFTNLDLSGLNDGTLTVSVVLTDPSGNAAGAVTDTAILDRVAPTVAITTGSSDPVSGAFTATFTFSEDVNGFAVGDITVGNGAASNFQTVSADVYTATITPAADGSVTVDVAAGVAQDDAGNDNTAATQFSIENDETVPTVAITTGSSDPVSGAFTATFTFSEDVSGFVIGDITVGNGAASNFQTVSDDVYTATITPAADGSVTVDVAAGVAQDDAGNNNTAATQFSIENDETAPTVTIDNGSVDPVGGAFSMTITFSEDVTGFALGDISVTNGVASDLLALDAATYDVVITPTTDGALTVDVAAGAAQDAAGNDNTAATQFSVTADLTAPTLALTTLATDPVPGSFILDMVFSEPVTGFDVSDLVVTNATTYLFGGSGTTYAVGITPTASGTVTVNVPGGAAVDAAGNNSVAAPQFTIEADLIDPTVTLSTSASDPVSGAFTLDVVFSEDVTGLAAPEFVVSNGVPSNLTGSGAIYELTITPTADGTVTVDLGANAAEDAAGNRNTAATQFSIEHDGTAPTLSINGPAGPVSGAFTATFTFSEDVTGFGLGDINVGNGSASGFSAISATDYSATITPSSDGTVTVDVGADAAFDTALNGNSAATQYSVENDATAPTVTLSTLSSDPVAGAFTLNVSFSEAVDGLAVGDFVVTNGTASDLAAAASSPALGPTTADYTVTITPAADGEVTVNLPAGVAQDSAGNTNTAAAEFSITNDETAPTVAISSAAGDPVSGVFSITVTFSEAVTGFVVGDLSVGNGSASNLSGAGAVYTADITPAADGTVTVDIAAAAAADSAGNTSTAATQFSVENDESLPTVAITSAASDPVSGAFSVTMTFSEDVTGFTVGDLTVGNGAASNFAGSGAVYTADITPAADGAVTVDIAAGAATDDAGNGNTAAPQFSIENDESRPEPVISSTAANPVAGAFAIEVDFGETVTGFVLADLDVTNGSASDFADSGGGVFTATITPASDGAVRVDIDSGVAQDGAGNNSRPADTFIRRNDETAPTVTLSSTAADPTSGAFSLDVVFSEDVSGLAAGDFTVGNGAASDLSGSGATYSVTITPAADGTVTVDLAAGAAQDDAGNDNTAATQFSIENDGSAPTVTLSSTATGPVSGAFTVDIVFSEAVTGFALGDLVVGNGNASAFAGSGTTYSATITPTADGEVTVDLAADAATDAAGNGNAAATQFSIINDESSPIVTLSTASNDPVSGPFTLDVVFSEDVTGLAVGDFTVGNGAASGLSGSGAVYTVTITPAADGEVTVDLAAGSARDAAGNDNAAATQFSITRDGTAPSVAITSDATGPVSGSFTITATFSEAVTGFDLSDVTVGNGAASDLEADPARGEASGTVFTALITPAADGEVTVDVAAGAAQDAAGNGNAAAAQFSIDTDGSAPGVDTITPTPSTIGETFVGDDGFSLAILFTEAMDTSSDPVIGFGVDVSTTLTASGGAWSGDGLTYTANFDVADNSDAFADIDVIVSGVQDVAGNALPDTTVEDVFTIDMAKGELRVEVITTGGDPAVPILIESDVDGVLFNSTIQQFVSIAATEGVVTVTATTPDDFVLDALVCVDPDGGSTVDLSTGVATVDVDNREDITCTYTYLGQGTITITGVANDEDGEFDFTGDLGAFTIAADEDGESRVFADVDAGTYAVTLSESDGFEFDSLSCDAGVSVDQSSRTATIELGAGDDVACTFEQTATPNLVVEENLEIEFVLPTAVTNPGDVNVDVPLGNSGTVPLNFTITVDADWITIDPTSGTIQPGEEILVNISLNDEIEVLEAGVYTATITITREQVSPGGSKDVSGAAGTTGPQVIQVPVTLTLQARRGTVQLVATTAPMAAGDASFGFASDIAAFDNLTLTTAAGVAQSAEADVLRGVYTVTQSLPDGWRVDSIECAGDRDGGNSVDIANGALTIDLDANEAMVCTFANVRDEDAVVLATQRAIRNFMVRRADRIIEASPDLSRRLDERVGSGPGGFAADATEGRWTMSAQASLSGIRREMAADDPEAAAAVDDRLDVWMSAEFASVSDDRAGDAAESDFGILHVGADVRVAPNLLIGAMAARDWSSESSGEIASHLGAIAGAEVEGEGWLAGPYAVYAFEQGGVFDIRALWGQSDNEVNPLGLYEDDFDTERFMIQANLSGEWVNGNWRIRPTTGLTHYEETQLAYTDSLGIFIPSQEISIGRFNAGPEIAYRFEGGNGGWWEPSLRINAIWDYDPAELMDETGALVGTASFRADARLGLTAEFANGARLTVDAGVAGLGEGELEATSGGFRFRFPM